MHYEEKTLAESTIFRGRLLTVRKDKIRLPNGHESDREYVVHPGGVCVAALGGDDTVLFVRQFRYPYHKELLELPAGKINPGEDPLLSGKRELKEETGAEAEEYRSLGTMLPSPGYTDEVIHLYLARGLSFGEQQPDDDEFLDVVRMPFAEAVRQVLDGTIADAKSQVLLLKIAALRQQGTL